ncbi:hypothetical protein V6N12_024877, partial [Hibiscus sabdariffa]
ADVSLRFPSFKSKFCNCEKLDNLVYIYRNQLTKDKKETIGVKQMERWVGKLSRQCYAVLCLSAILALVTIAHLVCQPQAEAEAEDGRQRTKRRLRSLHGSFSY